MPAKLSVVADNTGTVLYEDMCKAIAECHRVDEVKTIRDKAIALEVYSRQAKNHENERMAREIRLRAERKAGELLAKLPRAPTRSRFVTGLSSSKEPNPRSKQEARGNTTKAQVHRWERIASIPKDEFEREVKKPKASTKSLNDYAKSREPPRPKPEKELPEWWKHSHRQVELIDALDRIVKGLKQATRGLKVKDEVLERMMEAGTTLPRVHVKLLYIQKHMALLMPLCPCPLRKGEKPEAQKPTIDVPLLLSNN